MKRMLLAFTLLLIPLLSVAQEEVSDDGAYASSESYVVTKSQYTSAKAYAKQSRWEHNINFTMGAPGPMSMLTMSLLSEDLWDDYYALDVPQSLSDKLADYRYYWGAWFMIPSFTLSYRNSINHWFWIGFKLGTATAMRKRYHSVTDDVVMRKYSTFLTGTVDFHFAWLNRENVQLYSALGIGVSHFTKGIFNLIPAIETTYFGICVGRGFYGFAELGGGQSGWFRGGFGVRF